MGEEVENSQEFTKEQRSSVAVEKNSRGYNWKVKVYDDDPDKALETTFRLEKKCAEKYGTETEKH